MFTFHLYQYGSVSCVISAASFIGMSSVATEVLYKTYQKKSMQAVLSWAMIGLKCTSRKQFTSFQNPSVL